LSAFRDEGRDHRVSGSWLPIPGRGGRSTHPGPTCCPGHDEGHGPARRRRRLRDPDRRGGAGALVPGPRVQGIHGVVCRRVGLCAPSLRERAEVDRVVADLVEVLADGCHFHRSGEAGAVSLKWSQFGADALSHARGKSWFPSWIPPYVRSPMPLPSGPPTPLRCITRPWTRMRPGQVNAGRYTCRQAGCAPCHTAMQGHASSSPPKRQPPRWLTAGRRPQGTDRTAVGGVGARERPTESSNPTAVPTGRIRRKVDAVTTDRPRRARRAPSSHWPSTPPRPSRAATRHHP